MRRALTATSAVLILATCLASPGAGAKTSEFVENTLKAFEPSLNAMDGLRANFWKGQIGSVLLADQEIPKIKAQIAKGTIGEHEGEALIDAHRATILNFLHEVGNEGEVMAFSGKVSDVPQLKKILGQILSVTRQYELMGETELAEAGAAQANRILDTFSEGFARTCKGQTYKQEFAVGLERQNQLLGKNIDLSNCVKPELANVRAWLLEFEIGIRADATEDKSQDGGDISQSSRKIDNVLKGTEHLQVKKVVGPRTLWTTSNSQNGQVDVTIDDLQSTFEKGGGEGDSWLAMKKSIHVKGKGQGSVSGGAVVESQADGTYNVRMPLGGSVSGQLTTEEKTECSMSETGFSCDYSDADPDWPQGQTSKSNVSTVNVVTFPSVVVPGLIENNMVHHRENQDAGSGFHVAITKKVEFDSGWIDVKTPGGPPMQVHVSYTLTAQ